MDVVFKLDKAVFNLRVAGIWIHNGHVLIHRLASDSLWSLPGGRITMNEESQKSLKREFLEELGVDIEIDRMVWSVENFFHYNGNDIHEIGFYYIVKSNHILTEKMDVSFHGIEGERLVFKWVPLENLEEIELYPVYLRTKLKEISDQEHFIVSNS